MRLEQRTYLDPRGKATTDRTQGVYLLGAEGAIIEDSVAVQVGLKQGTKPADKMATRSADKSMPVLSMPRKARRKPRPITVPAE